METKSTDNLPTEKKQKEKRNWSPEARARQKQVMLAVREKMATKTTAEQKTASDEKIIAHKTTETMFPEKIRECYITTFFDEE